MMPYLLNLGMTSPQTYKLKIQAQGRVIVPTDVRANLGVQEGDELILVKEEYGYRLTSRRLLAESLYGSLKKAEDEERDFTQELLDDRKVEAEGKGW
ncbi:AbrB/MazE/SpoVT family DNA-binding domain-containing protein [Deinococcus sp. VB343]|uniref:AbrB/MazE/SpoVT family DNA-binding domain-containing protein n=1 Tax=Deinococcus sp. VB343 TaxID=3385567 RepID=UPI0039C901EE